MQSGDEASGDIEKEKKKAVVFVGVEQESPVQIGRPLIYHHQTVKKDNTKERNISKIVHRCLRERAFDELDAFAKSSTAGEVETFYKKEAGLLLSGFIILSFEPFKYLLDHIPHESVMETLSNNNFFILRSFLISQKIREEGGRGTEGSRELAAKKLNAILQLEDEAINNFIRNNEDYKFIIAKAGGKLSYS